MKRGHLEPNVLVLVTLSLVAFGMVMVYSATSASATIGGGNPAYYLKRQGVYAALGVVLLVVAMRWNYRTLRHMAPALVLGSLFLLALALVAGDRVNGASRWLQVGPVTFQPSELAKPALAIWMALYLARRPVPRTLAELTRPIGLLTAVFCALVLAEPDLGTVIALCVMVGAMLVVAGAPIRMMSAATTIVGTVVLFAIWLEPYRRSRVFSFINPWHDAQGAGYQTVQAMVGLGSGGVFGRGLGESVAEGLLPPRGPHGHDLRDHRRGARARRIDARDRGVRSVCLGRHAYRPALPGPVRERAGDRDHYARVRPGGAQPRCGRRDRTPDRNPAAARLVRRHEPRGHARLRRNPP